MAVPHLPHLPDLLETAIARTPAGVLPTGSRFQKRNRTHERCRLCSFKVARRGLCRSHYDDLATREAFGLPKKRQGPRPRRLLALVPKPKPDRSVMTNAFRFLLALEARHFGWTAPELAEELEASERQVYRWIHEAEAAGVPITKVDDRWRLV